MLSLCRELGKEMADLLESFGRQHGVTVEYVGGKFTSVEFTAKISLKVKQTATGESAEQINWNRYAKYFGFIIRFYPAE